jgi:DNA-binding NtrC family response regulator
MAHCPELESCLKKELPVYLIREGFNLDRALRAIRSGRFEKHDADGAVRILSEAFLREDESVDRSHAIQGEARNPDFVFVSREMQKLDYEISRVARFDFDVLLSGETGVGKDFVASEIHRRSGRGHRPFLSVPLRSLSPTLIESELFGHERGAFSGAERSKPGKFEAAEGGTMYIPEISCLSEDVQLKLLYFMQYKRCLRVGEDPRHHERNCDVRLILATNDDLSELVAQGKLREDFYYRINGLSLHIPPLRQRREDIVPLARHFIDLYGFGKPYDFTQSAIDRMHAYDWPGNVRELANTIKAAIPFASDGVVSEDVLPIKCSSAGHADFITHHLRMMQQLPTYTELEDSLRRSYFQEALLRCQGHVPRAACLAGMSEQGFRKAILRMGFEY